MARQMTSTPSTSPQLLLVEVARFAGMKALADGDESHNRPFLNALCQAFQAKLLTYYDAGATAEERLLRLGEISQLIREVSFTDGQQTFTVASTNAGMTAEAAYAIGAEGCEPPLICVDRNCVPPPPGG